MSLSPARSDTKAPAPFALPHRLPPVLGRVQAYWAGLLRGAADMPFWDDARLTDLPDLADRLMLIDVFQKPERFRFNTIGAALTSEPLAGMFLDEVRLDAPFEFLASQCAATVESRACTWFREERRAGMSPSRGYARLILPMWGDGRIGMLLVAYDFD